MTPQKRAEAHWWRFKRTKTDKERWEDKVDFKGPDQCWPWKGNINWKGYGGIWWPERGSNIPAHKASYLLNIGDIPQGLFVLHKCDNPRCVNPNHLFLGTHKDNMKDKTDRGRQHRPVGSTNGNATLTEDDVLEIRKRFNGSNRKELAEFFNVTRSNVNCILRRKTWNHL